MKKLRWAGALMLLLGLLALGAYVIDDTESGRRKSQEMVDDAEASRKKSQEMVAATQKRKQAIDEQAAKKAAAAEANSKSMVYFDNDGTDGVADFTALPHHIVSMVEVVKIGENSLRFPGRRIVAYHEDEPLLGIFGIPPSAEPLTKAAVYARAKDGIVIVVPKGTKIDHPPRLHELDLKELFVH